MSDQTEDQIVEAIAREFPSFGGGKEVVSNNPLDHWLKDSPPQFALGVDVRAVVQRVRALSLESLIVTTSRGRVAPLE